MFDDFEVYKRCLTEIYGDVDEREEATRIIWKLCIKESYLEYRAIFQQYAPKLGWDDIALMATFREGLINAIKDEMIRLGKPATFANMIQIIIVIAQSIRERELKRKAEVSRTRVNPVMIALYWKNNKSSQESQKQGKGKPQNKGQAKKKEGSCYNCGKASHWAKECRAPKKQTAAIARKATKAPKEKKTEVAGPKGLLEKPPIKKDYQDWERENWQLGESIEPLEEWIKISTTDEKYAKYKRTLTMEIQGPKSKTRTTPDKQKEIYYQYQPPACKEECWDCYNNECKQHKIYKETEAYWPSKDGIAERMKRINPRFADWKENLNFPVTNNQMVTLAGDEHRTYHWTNCEISSCMFYLSDKIRLGWYENPYAWKFYEGDIKATINKFGGDVQLELFSTKNC
ncbi:hypothetical protein EG329_008562 [Mollisiaceae sp. DMI_Dod_QoI]|nr:hypothetical protein EG329_008562 [Helotiales sp. DMI_Dod_QoI]